MKLPSLLALAGLSLLVAPIQAAGSAPQSAAAAVAPQLPPPGVWSDTWNLKASVTITSDSDADAIPSVDLLGGNGTFTYFAGASTNACVVASDGEGTPPVPEAGACSISGGGNYTNIVCGTGTVNGGTINSILADKGTGSFSVIFVLGIGVLTGTFTETGTADDPADGTDTLRGLMVLAAPVPPSTPDDNGDCTEGFTVFAHIVGTD